MSRLECIGRKQGIKNDYKYFGLNNWKARVAKSRDGKDCEGAVDKLDIKLVLLGWNLLRSKCTIWFIFAVCLLSNSGTIIDGCIIFQELSRLQRIFALGDHQLIVDSLDQRELGIWLLLQQGIFVSLTPPRCSVAGLPCRRDNFMTTWSWKVIIINHHESW